MTNQEHKSNRTETRSHWEKIPRADEFYTKTNIEDDFKFKYLPVHPALNARVPYVKTDTLTGLIETNSRDLILGGALEIAQTKARNIEAVN